MKAIFCSQSARYGMNNMRTFEFVENNRMFKGLSSSLLRNLSSSFKQAGFSEGVYLCRTGETVEQIGVVTSGSAELRVEDRLGNAVRFHLLCSGQFFGESAALDDGRSVYDIRAVAPLRAIMLSRSSFLKLLGAHSAVLWNAYQLNLERLKMLCMALVKPRKTQGFDDVILPENSIIRDAVQFIDGKYGEQITLDELAHVSKLSRFHFARRFKEITGYPFKEYLNRKRVREAKNLMQLNGFNISEACYAVGFGDLSYFSRVFRRIEGQSPSDYRKGLRYRSPSSSLRTS